MKRKKQILNFLNDNYGMINSLMCESERKTFHGDIVKPIMDELKKQIESEGKNNGK